MKQKIISLLWIIFFFTLTTFLYGKEYWDFHSDKTSQKEQQILLQTSSDTFQIENILNLWETIELFSTPEDTLLDQIIQEIETAQKKIYVEVYIFTEKTLRQALIEAHKRGIEVKVLLENNPYQTPYINDETFRILQQEGIEVAWSDPLMYSLNHSKLLIVDDISYISTWNFSQALFTKNRDFLVKIHDWGIQNVLEHIFLRDFSGQGDIIYHPNIILSPEYSREKLTKLIDSAQSSIDFYFPYIQDTDFQNLLFQKSLSWVQIRAIVEKGFFEDNPQTVELFREHKIDIVALQKNYLHGKALCIDKKNLYVGSVNFSTYSLDENREVGIIISEKSQIERFFHFFENDFSLSKNH